INEVPHLRPADRSGCINISILLQPLPARRSRQVVQRRLPSQPAGGSSRRGRDSGRIAAGSAQQCPDCINTIAAGNRAIDDQLPARNRRLRSQQASNYQSKPNDSRGAKEELKLVSLFITPVWEILVD